MDDSAIFIAKVSVISADNDPRASNGKIFIARCEGYPRNRGTKGNDNAVKCSPSKEEQVSLFFFSPRQY